MSDSINWKWTKNSVRPAGAGNKIPLDIFFQPGLTWIPESGAQGIALLFIEDTTDTTDPAKVDQQDFREFAKNLLKWVWQAGRPDAITAASHQNLVDLYESFVKTPFSYAQFDSFLQENFIFRIQALTQDKDCTIFPMFPQLSMRLGENSAKPISFEGTVLTSTQLTTIQDLFSSSKVKFKSNTTTSSVSESLSLTQYLFRGYAHLMAKNMLQVLVDASAELAPVFRNGVKVRMQEIENNIRTLISQETGAANDASNRQAAFSEFEKVVDALLALEEGNLQSERTTFTSMMASYRQAEGEAQDAQNNFNAAEQIHQEAVEALDTAKENNSNDTAALETAVDKASQAVGQASQKRDDANQKKSAEKAKLKVLAQGPLAVIEEVGTLLFAPSEAVERIKAEISTAKTLTSIAISDLNALKDAIDLFPDYPQYFSLDELIVFISLKEQFGFGTGSPASTYSKNPYSNIAGMASRFLMHGLRLPRFNGNTMISGTDESLYQATAQQFSLSSAEFELTPDPRTFEYRLYLNKGTNASHLSFTGGAVNDELEFVISANDSFQGGPVFNEVFSLNAIPWYRHEPFRFALRQHTSIEHADKIKYLISLPASLQTHLKEFAGQVSLPIKRWPGGKHQAERNLSIEDWSISWATSIEIPIQLVNNSEGEWLADAYRFTGITEAEKDLLEAIISADPGVSIQAFQLLFPTDNNTELASIDTVGSFLLKDILYTSEALSADFQPTLAMLKLIWEGSSVESGNYYLYLPGIAEEARESLFKESTTARLKLLIEFGDNIHAFNNHVLLENDATESLHFDTDVILAESNQLMPILQVPPGFQGFYVNRSPSPDEDIDKLDNLYHLLGYTVGTNRTGLPIGPTESDAAWLYERLVPISSTFYTTEKNPYQDILLTNGQNEASLPIQTFWQDLYGNKLAATKELSKDFEIAYTDPLIGINQWPSVVESFEIRKVNGDPSLLIHLAFDTSPYLHPVSENIPFPVPVAFEDENSWHPWKKRAESARDTFQKVAYQLAQDDIKLKVSTSLALETINAESQHKTFLLPASFKAELIAFVDDCLTWLETAESAIKPSAVSYTQDLSNLTIRNDFVFELTAGLTIGRNEALIHTDLFEEDANGDLKISPKHANVLASQATLTPRLSSSAASSQAPLSLVDIALQNSKHADLLQAVSALVKANMDTSGILMQNLELQPSSLSVENSLLDMKLSDWETFAEGALDPVTIAQGDTFRILGGRLETSIGAALGTTTSVTLTHNDLAAILANVPNLFAVNAQLNSPTIIPSPVIVSAGQSLQVIAAEQGNALDASELVSANENNSALLQAHQSFIPAELTVEEGLFANGELADWEAFLNERISIQSANGSLEELADSFMVAWDRPQTIGDAELSAILLNESGCFREDAALSLPKDILSIQAYSDTGISPDLGRLARMCGLSVAALLQANQKQVDLVRGGITISFSELDTNFEFEGSLSRTEWQAFLDEKTIKTWENESFLDLAARVERQLIATLGRKVEFTLSDLAHVLSGTEDLFRQGVSLRIGASISSIKLREADKLKTLSLITGFFAAELVKKNWDTPTLLKTGLSLDPAELQVDSGLYVSIKQPAWDSFAKYAISLTGPNTLATLRNAFESKMEGVLGRTVTFSLNALAAVTAHVTTLLRSNALLFLPAYTSPQNPTPTQMGDTLKHLALGYVSLAPQAIVRSFVRENAETPRLVKNGLTLFPQEQNITTDDDTFESLATKAFPSSPDTRLLQLADGLLGLPASESTQLLNAQASPVGANNLSLKYFARNFENAFEGICIAASEDKNKQKNKHTESRRPLFCVRLGSQATDTVHVDILESERPDFWAIPPLANTLLSANINVDAYVPGANASSMFAPAEDATQFQNIDINNLARSFLEAVEDFCDPEHLIPAFNLQEDAKADVEKILQIKSEVAKKLASTVAPILQRNSGDRDQAVLAILEELLVDLVKGYDIETIVQHKVSIANANGILLKNGTQFDNPRIRGKAKVKKVERGEVLRVEVDPKGIDFTFSNGEFQLQGAESYFTYLFDTKTPEQFASLSFELDFVITDLEYDIKAMGSAFPNHEASNWLSFIHPEKLTQSMGTVPVPIPLHNYPMPPSLILQQAESDPTSLTELRDVRQWEYTIIYEHLDVAQDSIECIMDFNVIDDPNVEGGFRSLRQGRDLLENLINFNVVYPLFKEDLYALNPLAIKAFAQLMEEIDAAWGLWNTTKLLSNSTLVSPLKASDYLKLEVNEEPISETDKQGVVAISHTSPSRIAAAELPKPRLELPGYKQKSETIVSPNGEIFTFTYEPDEGDLTTFGDSSIPDRKLTIENLDVIEHQNAWAKIWLSRNKNLVHGETTNPAFVFRTPVVRFASRVTPFITNDEPWDIATLSSPPEQPFLSHMERFIQVLFPKATGINYEVRMSCRYAFEMVRGKGLNANLKPILPLLMGLRLNPLEEIEIDGENKLLIDQYPAMLDKKIKAWFETNKPSITGASIIFSVNLFSKLEEDSTTSFPMLKINHLELNLKDVTDLPE